MKDVNVTLGERVKLVRNANKLTREKLAELIDVSPRFLAEVESGKVGVSLQTLKNLCSALSTTSDYLLGLDNENKISQLELIYNQLSNVDEKFYPLIFALINELKNIDFSQ
ncbi:MAG: helix-turn-helix domain-containing protein [Candidatus Coproplasma sp.]